MKSYISPSISFGSLIAYLIKRKTVSNTFIDALKHKNKGYSLIIRQKERYVLYTVLKKLGWKNKTIALPRYTCNSLEKAILASGNLVIFYDCDDNLQIPPKSTEVIIRNNAQAILISDVYGVKVEIPSELSKRKDLIKIGDFAHHLSFSQTKDQRSFDILLYSSSYYKPINSMGVGLGLIRSELIPEDDLSIQNNLFRNIYSALLFYLFGFLLNSFILKFYLQNKKRFSEEIFPIPATNAPAFTINISLLEQYIDPQYPSYLEERSIFARQYFKEANNIKFIPATHQNLDNLSYLAVRVPANKRDEIRMKLISAGIIPGQVFSTQDILNDHKNTIAQKLGKEVIVLPFLPQKIDFNKLIIKFSKIIDSE